MSDGKYSSVFEREAARAAQLYGPKTEGRILNTSFIKEEDVRETSHGHGSSPGEKVERYRKVRTDFYRDISSR